MLYIVAIFILIEIGNIVSHNRLNTLAPFRKTPQFGDKNATCGDQSPPDLYGKQVAGKTLCLPRTIGFTTGGLVIYCACAMKRQPDCMIFSQPIASLGEDFLNYVKDRMKITIKENGIVEIE